MSHAAKQQFSKAVDMPYFEGDHWPAFVETAIEDANKNVPFTTLKQTPVSINNIHVCIIYLYM